MSAPSLLPSIAPTTDEEAEARKALAEIHEPILDELRVKIPQMLTSDLLVSMWPGALGQIFHTGDEISRNGIRTDTILMAAFVALCDEINRRMPIPK